MGTGRENEPWLQRPGESDEAFAAFNTYREMPPRSPEKGGKRSVRNAARKLHVSSTFVQKLSRKWGWPDRAVAWDNHLVRTATQATTQKVKTAVEEMTERHLNIALFLQTKGVNSIQQTDGPLSPLVAKDYIKLGVDMERLLRGEPTEFRESKSEISIADPYDELTTEELRALAALHNEQAG